MRSESISNRIRAKGQRGAIAAFGGVINKLVKKGADTGGRTGLLSAAIGKGVYYLAGLVVPLFLWLVYLSLTRWGIRKPKLGVSGDYTGAPDWLGPQFDNWDDSLEVIASYFGLASTPIAFVYFVVVFFLFLICLVVSPNAYSLHLVYRDRLSQGFIKLPGVSSTGKNTVGENVQVAVAGEPRLDQQLMGEGDPKEFKLSDISKHCAPYHLVNAALNIQGSPNINQRGRNADFFIFSRQFVGSPSTGYCRTETVENAAADLNLGTAMAVSGAAASANMGANTIKPLVFSLSLLNVRLGYWLPNPSDLCKAPTRLVRKIAAGPFWFLLEVFGLLKETSANVYLTDGGHIENLGIYELLKRRCRVIIAVDAEADPDMDMNSLIKLQQYARIDMGIRIDLEWDKIRSATLNFEVNRKNQGPHCAVGRILYEGETGSKKGEEGILIYVKSSLSGDENDYIRDYKRRYPSFPHQTTGDQFFSEEQFEVYRGLGFHAVSGLLDGRATAQGLNDQLQEHAEFVQGILKTDLGLDQKIRWVEF